MAETRVIKIFIDDGSLEKVIEKDRKLIAKLDRQLADLTQGSDKWNKVTAEREKVLHRISQAEGQLSGKLGPTLQQLRAKQRELNRELSQMPLELRAASNAAQQLKKIDAELVKVKNEARATGRMLSRLKGGIGKVADGFNKYLGVAAAAIGALSGLAMGFMNQVKRAGDLSDAYADVAKTTGLTIKETKELDKELRSINTRSSRSELLKLASQAGKLGITGKKDIVDFTDAADKINVSLGEDLGEGAIVNLGKINELMGTNAQYGYGEAMLKTGSAINALGANSMAAEGFLVEMTKRLGGVGAQSKMSVPEILGLSSTVDNLGMQAEMSGTAIQNVLLDMFQDTPKFAKMAGMGLQEFSDLMNADVNEAFIRVLEGVKGNNTGMKELSGNVAKLGVDGARGASVIMALAGKTDFLRGQQALANDEYDKGTSILDEFNTKNENAAAKLEKLSKNVSASLSMMITPETVSGMVDFTNRFLGFETAAQQASDAMDRQRDEVNRLEKQTSPLIARYEELQNQTETSVEEQEEMQGILEKLRETIPFTAFEFDEYGNAISVSTQKSKEFIEQQKEILKVKTKEAFEENKDAAIEYANELNVLMFAEKELRAGRKMNVAGRTFDPKEMEDMKEFESLIREQRAKVQMTLQEIENTGREVIGSTESNTTRLFGVISMGQTKTLGEIATMVNYVNEQTAAVVETVKKGEETKVDLNKLTNIELQKIAADNTNTQSAMAKGILEAREKFEKEANEKSGKEAQRLLDAKKRDLEKYLDDLSRLNEEVATSSLEGQEREVFAVQLKYAKIIDEGKRLKQDITQLEELKQKEIELIDKKYSDKKAEEEEKERNKKEEEEAKANEKRLQEEKSVEEELLRMRRDAQGDELAQLNAKYDDMREKAHENQELLAEIEKQRIDAVDLYERQKRQAMGQYLLSQGEQVFGAISQIVSNNRRQENDEAIQANQERGEREMASLDAAMQRDLSRKSLTESQKAKIEEDYQRKKQQLAESQRNRENQLKLQQWQAEKRASLFQAVIAGALATIKALPNWPNAIAAGVAAAAQIAIIAAQKPPKFSKGARRLIGGVPDGPSHASGGIDLINSTTRQKVGEMEGGEPYMILSRNTYRNNRDLVDSLLHSSLNRNGAPIQFPRFGKQPRLDYNKVMQAANYPRFALGGVTAAPPSESSGSSLENPQTEYTAELIHMIEMNTRVMMELKTQLQKPVKAITVIGNEQAEELEELNSENQFINGGGAF